MAQRLGESPDRFRHLREADWDEPSVIPFICDICGLPYPETHLKWQSQRRVCPDDYENGGGTLERDITNQRLIGRGADREARKRVPKYPWAQQTQPMLTSIQWAHPGLPGVLRERPVAMLASGAITEVTLTGVNLTSADVTLAYGGSIIDDSSPTYSSDETTITLQLDPGATPGDFDLEFNGVLYRKVFYVYEA